MLQVVLWKWHQIGGFDYGATHVNFMCSMLRRNLVGVPHRIVCITDDAEGIVGCETAALWNDGKGIENATRRDLPSCYRRLKLYDRATQQSLNIHETDRILSLDLDTVIIGDLTELVQTEGVYVGWGLRNLFDDRPVFNGSLQMFWANTLQDVWDDFDMHVSPRFVHNKGYLGSDQAWLSYKLIGREGCIGLGWPLVASYPLQVRVQNILKRETRIVFFHGPEKPWQAQTRFNASWISRYWRM